MQKSIASISDEFLSVIKIWSKTLNFRKKQSFLKFREPLEDKSNLTVSHFQSNFHFYFLIVLLEQLQLPGFSATVVAFTIVLLESIP
jgi:hypothetical protein